MNDINHYDENSETGQFLDSQWDDDIQDDLKADYQSSLELYSRDWTVATIHDQIKQQNIDLNPNFQRRNVWDDIRRSRLIESLILGIPVPEIILAENNKRRRSYLVIDGKQRLLTIAGFLDPALHPHWNKAQLKGLKVLKELNGKTFEDLEKMAEYERYLLNGGIRCSIIAQYGKDDILYDIFYRLNTGSVPLSTQELRQVLNPGHFADYLIEKTNEPGQPLQRIMNLKGPDKRLRDVELILRFIALYMFGETYHGNLKAFLDESMQAITQEWDNYYERIEVLYSEVNRSMDLLIQIFQEPTMVGRKYSAGKWEKRFNKVLWEVEVYYFLDLIDMKIDEPRRQRFIDGFRKLCEDPEFQRSIEATTKTNAQYATRFRLFSELINKVFSIEPRSVPIR